jgi:hypothetical protein
VIRAALGERETDSGTIKVRPEEATQARRQALGVWAKSIVTGLLCAAIVWYLAARVT